MLCFLTAELLTLDTVADVPSRLPFIRMNKNIGQRGRTLLIECPPYLHLSSFLMLTTWMEAEGDGKCGLCVDSSVFPLCLFCSPSENCLRFGSVYNNTRYRIDLDTCWAALIGLLVVERGSTFTPLENIPVSQDPGDHRSNVNWERRVHKIGNKEWNEGQLENVPGHSSQCGQSLIHSLDNKRS